MADNNINNKDSGAVEDLLDMFNNFTDDDDAAYISKLRMLEDTLEVEKESKTVTDSTGSVFVTLLKNNLFNVLVFIAYFVMIIHIGLVSFLYYKGISDIVRPFGTNYISVFIWAIVPFFLWLFSTTRWCKFWGYRNRRIFGYVLFMIHAAVSIAPLLYNTFFNIFMPLVLKIPLSRDITPGMVLNLGRGLYGIFTFFFVFLIAFLGIRPLHDEQFFERIATMKIDKYWDLRKNKGNVYDCHFMRRNDNGAVVNIPMESRYIHAAYIGASGSGKTSMLMSRSIVDDLTVKAKNMDKLAQIAETLTKKKVIAPIEKFDQGDFSPAKFTVLNSDKAQKWKKMLDKYLDCGITAIAPNASFADEIYEYARKKGFTKVNRVDPVLTEDDKHKAGYIGFNPLYISPGKTDFQRKLEIIKKARNFADVMSALNEMKGQGDPYFSNLNNLLTNYISILVMVAYPLLNEGKQPNLRHVQEIFNNFDKAKQYYDVLSAQDAEMVAEYQMVLDFVKNKLLDEKARQKLAEHATGLTVLINNFMGNKLISNVLCAERSIDLDKCLSEGQITVVNFALELSRDDASVFGNFFILNFISAVFRRSKKGRIPHFLFIDEWPVLVNNHHRQMFDLFRQYKVGVAVALQSLDQIDTPKLQGMKSAVLTTGLTVVYGRTSENEMKTFQTLGGTKWDTIEQKTISERSITDADTDLSYSTRTTKQKIDFLEGSNIRFQDFQNAYVFMVDRGNPVPPFQVKTDFLNDFELRSLKRYKCDWNKLYEEYGIASSEVPKEIAEQAICDVKDEAPVEMPEIKENGSVNTNISSLDDLFASYDTNAPKAKKNGSVKTIKNTNSQDNSLLHAIDDAGEEDESSAEELLTDL